MTIVPNTLYGVKFTNCILYMVVMHKNYQVPDRIGRDGNACPGRPVISKKMKHGALFLPFLWAFPEAHFHENSPKYFLNEKDKRQKTAAKAAVTIKNRCEIPFAVSHICFFILYEKIILRLHRRRHRWK